MSLLFKLLEASVWIITTSVLPIAASIPNQRPSLKTPEIIRVCGSPQMGELLQHFEARFRKLHPDAKFQNSLTSTLTAVDGIAEGRADLCLLGREIWPKEIQAFEATKKYPPRVVEVATGSFDVPKATFALMIFVHRDNPLASLSTDQLARIFGVTAEANDQPVLRTWGDLGLTGALASKPIHLYGFATENDKSQIFSQLVFTRGQHWNSDLHAFANDPGPQSLDAGDLIVQAVAADPESIGISNIHYATSAVRALPLSTTTHLAPIIPTRETVASHLYPLTRSVYMVTDRTPSANVLEFLKYVLTTEGQQAVSEEGNYLPLSPSEANAELHKLSQ